MLIRGMVFTTYYPMAKVKNRDENRFAACVFNENNSREIMPRAWFDGRFFMAVPVASAL